MQVVGTLAWGFCLGLLLGCAALGSPESNKERNLYNRLFDNYDKSQWPVQRTDEVLQVFLKLTLTNLISLNAKEETLTTNVWIAQQWVDYRLNFTKEEYDKELRVPADHVWLPDIVLENNIDGNFEVAYSANVLISPGGEMYWQPPAIFRSSCPIEVTFFPFDWQNCSLIFRWVGAPVTLGRGASATPCCALGIAQGEWEARPSPGLLLFCSSRSKTHNAREVELQYGLNDTTFMPVEEVIIEDFTENGEWALIYRPARRVLAPIAGLEAPGFSEIHYFLIIQRKPLFYIINIIVPCVLISSLVVLVYFLPAQAGGQKCTVSISVLLAQTVFLFLIAQKVPATSLSVPLIGKYLLFVMTVATLIVTNCVVVLNISLRSPSTHLLSPRLKRLFLKILPHYLGSTIGPADEEFQGAPCPRRSLSLLVKAEEYILKKARSEVLFEHQGQRHGLQRVPDYDGLDVQMTTMLYKNLSSLAPEIKECVDACNFISKSTKEQNSDGAEMENWMLIGQMIDKLCFWLAILLFTIGTLAIFFMGHLNTVPEDPFPSQ
ncbi:acetylcholine receptor subunit epsilon isoform X2 [Pantherophis guttatus]|uniref:Acetylcholine receptor subunit epsilon isoform X2 n=1 Tax=Pantherophis guttatus TaxID=94885 RepID=A0ABM3YX05_PANGU|nr:acetylcholine receptor subunit epsilon isoform X2 [Pantherophis guttatus]